jgi:hypothetical protein
VRERRLEAEGQRSGSGFLDVRPKQRKPWPVRAHFLWQRVAANSEQARETGVLKRNLLFWCTTMAIHLDCQVRKMYAASPCLSAAAQNCPLLDSARDNPIVQKRFSPRCPQGSKRTSLSPPRHMIVMRIRKPSCGHKRNQS